MDALPRAPRHRRVSSKLGMVAASLPASFHIKCGRCGVIFAVHECLKLEHFSIYRAICPHCRWPGRYLASELHANLTGKSNAVSPADSKPCQ